VYDAVGVGTGFSGQTYEVEMRGTQKAQHVHDVVLHHVSRRATATPGQPGRGRTRAMTSPTRAGGIGRCATKRR
jgi:hypothetical protein